MIRKSVLTVTLLFLVSSFSLAQPSHPAANKDEIAKKARQSYYSLKNLGVSEFACKVEPDWDTMYKSVPTDDLMKTEVIPLLKQTQFEVRVSGTGGATVSKKTDSTPPSFATGERFRSASGSMEQVLTGFFQSWSVMMFNIPIPEPGDKFQFEDLGESYRFTMQDGDTTAILTFDRALQMKIMTAKGPSVDSTLQLRFDKSKNGLLVLSGYTVDIPIGDGKTVPMTLDVKHHDFDGVLLPETVSVFLDVPNRPTHLNITFKDCQFKKP